MLHNIFMKCCPSIPNFSKDILKNYLTTEAYLESSRTSMMKFFCKNSSQIKKEIQKEKF